MIEIGDQKIRLPKGVEIVGEYKSGSGYFDQDATIRLMLNPGAEGILGGIQEHLEPLAPFQGPTIDVIAIHYMDPERIEDVDTNMYAPEGEIYGLSGFGFRKKMIMLNTFILMVVMQYFVRTRIVV